MVKVSFSAGFVLLPLSLFSATILYDSVGLFVCLLVFFVFWPLRLAVSHSFCLESGSAFLRRSTVQKEKPDVQS